MKDQARIVVIGGGIVGCSIAYHLSRLGESDVLVLEKGALTSGSTWHAAGLVGQLRSSRNVTRMLKYSVELYGKLEAETGQATGWRPVGGLRIASSQERMLELRRAATTAKSFGLELHLLSPAEALKLFPLMSPDGIVGGAFLPTDGDADPSSVTNALAKGARDRGVVFETGIRVTDILLSNGRVAAVVTDKGTVRTEVVVNAAGMWAREIGRLAGVDVPLIPVSHQYMVTGQIAGVTAGLPTMRDPDNLVYYKEEAGALVMGGYERDPIPWSVDGIPRDFTQQLLESDYDHFNTLAESALRRTPILEEAGVKRLINGPEAFTPDGHFIMGEAPEVGNFFVAAGFNAHGIAAGGGAGRMLAEWIVAGEPSLDLWEVDIRRFGPHHNNTPYLTARTSELYGKHYAMNWPHQEHSSARGVKTSPLYATLKAQGAVFGAKFGWERANWFAANGDEPRDIPTFGRPNWFAAVGREHAAARERVALIDQTSFAKFEVSGPGAFDFLQRLAARNLSQAEGKLNYTQLCNSRGGIEADLTIARLGPETFYIVTGTAFGTHDAAWIKRHMPAGGGVSLRDVTSQYAVLNLCGPKSRRLLEKTTDDDVSNESLKFAECRRIRIGPVPVLAARVTYVGELGFELHVPVDRALEVYDRLREAGREFGLVNAGYRAIESLRLEKGYRYWSAELTPDYNPYEAGLGAFVSLKKGDFIGREALARVAREGPRRTLCCFTLAEPVQLYGGETICRAGEVLGVLTSGGWGYTLGKTIAYGYVASESAVHADYVIEVMGKPVAALRHDEARDGALFDPRRERILA